MKYPRPEMEGLASIIASHRITIVSGPVGSGRSSLVAESATKAAHALGAKVVARVPCRGGVSGRQMMLRCMMASGVRHNENDYSRKSKDMARDLAHYAQLRGGPAIVWFDDAGGFLARAEDLRNFIHELADAGVHVVVIVCSTRLGAKGATSLAIRTVHEEGKPVDKTFLLPQIHVQRPLWAIACPILQSTLLRATTEQAIRDVWEANHGDLSASAQALAARSGAIKLPPGRVADLTPVQRTVLTTTQTAPEGAERDSLVDLIREALVKSGEPSRSSNYIVGILDQLEGWGFIESRRLNGKLTLANVDRTLLG
jgi:hypothetical protein